jgi:hypothetical protein
MVNPTKGLQKSRNGGNLVVPEQPFKGKLPMDAAQFRFNGRLDPEPPLPVYPVDLISQTSDPTLWPNHAS